ncbi:Phosphotransferase enzyme family protein [Actinokineospora alba]|uniref:Phosphotransferase enzyme family protein n=1 Tax=Actinokineospora alba TaxID=504798 RepID=A0A1H0HG62_9PSEU|nr:phosphotransferase [Actinokineospora alba]TDP64908.1 phosphotransferase family enzyme [Actinokineospora alba]SDH49120.1 Phosphotransferase enzyme family protein [Actinokineospora alba]SDO17821.1 Phosphotransferase enzyme family protein [Actinokineospora alba]
MTQAAADGLRSAVWDWAEEMVGPITERELLSTSNSTVWRVRSASGEWALKHLADTSSAPQAESVVLGRLAATAAVRRIRALAEQPDGSSFVLSEYVPGEVLADVLPTATPEQCREWARRQRLVIDAVGTIPVTGFGKVRVAEDGRTLCAEHPSWTSFLGAYLDEQRRKAPALADLRHDRLRAALDAVTPELEDVEPLLMPADVNSRNYVVDGFSLTCTNIPVAWSGDPLAAYGEALLHWSDTEGVAVFERATAKRSRRALRLYAAFHAYVILAYVERFAAEPLDEATPWGARTPLLTLLDSHLAAVEEAGDAR